MMYLVAIHRPDNYDAAALESEAMMKEIGALNRKMMAADVRIFACGLGSVNGAKSLRAQPDGTVSVTDGPYLNAGEHVGGFWVLETASLEEALEWGRKAVVACRASVEVRSLFQKPTKPDIIS